MSTGGRKTRRRYQSRLTSTLPSSTLALWWVWLLEHSRCLLSFLSFNSPPSSFLHSFLHFYIPLPPLSLSFSPPCFSSLSPSSSFHFSTSSLSFSPSSSLHFSTSSSLHFSTSSHSQIVECPDDSLNHLVTVAAKRLHTALSK